MSLEKMSKKDFVTIIQALSIYRIISNNRELFFELETYSKTHPEELQDETIVRKYLSEKNIEKSSRERDDIVECLYFFLNEKEYIAEIEKDLNIPKEESCLK